MQYIRQKGTNEVYAIDNGGAYYVDFNYATANNVFPQVQEVDYRIDQKYPIAGNVSQISTSRDSSQSGADLGVTGGPTGQTSVTDQLKQYVDSLYNQGYVLNPNVQITPEKVAEFTAQASSEIDPYYQTQLKLAREQLLSSAGYTVDQINQYETNLEQQYGRDLKSYQGTEAEKGFAQSGERTLGEQQLAQQTQQQILQNRQTSQQTLANQGRTFAQQYGGMFGEATPQGPQIGAMPTVSAGSVNFDRTGGTSPFYTLSSDVYSGLTGEQEFGRRSAELQRTSELESAYRTQQTIPRQLTL